MHLHPGFARGRDCNGLDIYVGIDVHRDSWTVCTATPDSVQQTFSQVPRAEALLTYLWRTYPRGSYHVGYEAGFSGYWLAEALRAQNVECRVLHADDIPTMGKEAVYKTDRGDARKIVEALRTGRYTSVYIPSPEVLADRTFVRARAALVRKQTRCKNQIRMLLLFLGQRLPEDLPQRHWSKRYLQALETLCASADAATSQSLRLLLDELACLRGLVARATAEIRTMARHERYAERAVWLCSLPGISTLSAMTILTEVVDIERFHSSDALACYLGIVPREHSSGQTQERGQMSHRGNPRLRWIFIEAAWVAIGCDPALAVLYAQRRQHMKGARAIVSIARHLVNRTYAVLKEQRTYVVR